MTSMWRVLSQHVLISEGSICVLLNALLFSLVWSREMRGTWMAYKLAITISACHGITMGILIVIGQFTHIFSDSFFIIICYGPFVYLSESWQRFLLRLACIACYTIYQFIPAPCLLQYLVLCHRRMDRSLRLLISYGYVSILIAVTFVLSTDFVPRTRQFASRLRSTAMRVQELDVLRDDFAVNGVGIFPDEANEGHNILLIAFGGIVPTYMAAYGVFAWTVWRIWQTLKSTGIQLSARTMQMQRQFIKNQILQGLIPFVGINVPMSIFLYGIITAQNIDNWTLTLPFTLWALPAVQALVYLNFCRNSIKSRMQTSGATTVVSVSAVTRKQT